MAQKLEFSKSGIGDCDATMKRAVGVFVLDKKVTTTLTLAEKLATWTAIIAGASSQTGFYIPINRGFQNNTAEPERITSNTNYTEKGNDPAPMFVGFMKSSFEDYKLLYPLDNCDVDIVLHLDDGKLWGYNSSASIFGGFRSNFTIRKNGPTDAPAEGFPIYLDFLSSKQLDNAVLITPDFDNISLVDAIPVGLSAEVTTAWASDTVTVKVLKRGSATPYAGLTLVDNWEVLAASTDIGASVSIVGAVNAALGSYVLTIASLTGNVWIRGINDDGTNLTYVTPPILIAV